MRFSLSLSLPIIAGIALLLLLGRLDLLLIVAPLSILISVLAAKGAHSGQRRM